jgi:hypothetical protein
MFISDLFNKKQLNESLRDGEYYTFQVFFNDGSDETLNFSSDDIDWDRVGDKRGKRVVDVKRQGGIQGSQSDTPKKPHAFPDDSMARAQRAYDRQLPEEQGVDEGRGFRGVGGGRSREDDEGYSRGRHGDQRAQELEYIKAVQAEKARKKAAEEKAKQDKGVTEAVPYALSAANAAAEYRRQGAAGGGYRGRIDVPVQSREDYVAAGQMLSKAARAEGQRIEYGLSDGVMSVFSDSMTADELDEFIDQVLNQGVAEGSSSDLEQLIQQYEDMVENVYGMVSGPRQRQAIADRDALEARIEAMPGGKAALEKWARAYNDGMDESVAEGSVQDKLHQRHQELRKKSGLPDPDYYKELKATYDLPDEERYAKAAELKKKYKVKESTVTNEDREKYLEEMRRAGYEVMTEAATLCPECGGPAYANQMLAEKQDACYHKVKSRYKVWPSAYASGALVRCRKAGAKNWGNKSKK